VQDSAAKRTHEVPSTGAEERVASRGGLRIHGLDLASLREGKLELTVPLHAGRFVLPRSREPVVMKVHEGSVAVLTVRIGRPDGAPRVTEARLEFSRPVVISNPASALKPRHVSDNATLNWTVNRLADAVTEMQVAGLFVDAEGLVHVPGHISKLGFRSDLDAEVGDSFPRLNLDLGEIVRTGLVAAPPGAARVQLAAAPGPAHAGLQELLKALGAITGQATFTLDADTDASAMRLEVFEATLESSAEPLRLHLEGSAQLDSDGVLRLRMTGPGAIRLDCGAGTVEGEVSLDVEAASLDGTGHAALELTTRSISSVLVHSGLRLRYCLDPGGTLSARADVSWKDRLVRLSGGQGRWQLGCSCAKVGIGMEGPLAAGASIDFSELRVAAEGRTGFAFDGDAWTTADGVGRADLRVHDIKARLAGIDMTLPGGADAVFTCDECAFDGKEVAWRGAVMYEFSGIGKRTVRFEADARGLTLDGQELVHTLPLHLDGFPDRIVKPGAPPFGSVADAAGLAALRQRVAEVTAHAVREHNNVRLLPEGDQSQQERLRIIECAGKGDKLCLQTLIFKDDESGTATAEALASAQARGAEVVVLVDTLGNTVGLDDLIEGKKIYETLRRAGVQVELYNSAGAATLQKLLRLASIHDNLPALGRIDQLSNPAVALAFFSQMAKAANGEGISAATRQAVHSAIRELSGSLAQEDAAASICAMKPHGHMSRGEFCALVHYVAVLNHRTHQKRLALVRADGSAEAVIGGRNIADEYLFRKGRLYRSGAAGKLRPAWRDTDLHVEGAAARDVFDGMRPMWKQVTGRDLSLLPAHRDGPRVGTSCVQCIEDRPHPDGRHNILNAEIEIVNSLGQGDVYYAANAYLCMEGAMARLKEAFIAAAARGTEIHLLTNSTDTTDLADVNIVGVFAYRQLLRAGVRIYERKLEEPLAGASHGGRTVHSKTAVAHRKGAPGSGVARISSWNKDNRSASLNAENAAYVWGDAALNEELEAAILHDISEAREVQLVEIERRPYREEIQASLRLMTIGKAL